MSQEPAIPFSCRGKTPNRLQWNDEQVDRSPGFDVAEDEAVTIPVEDLSGNFPGSNFFKDCRHGIVLFPGCAAGILPDWQMFDAPIGSGHRPTRQRSLVAEGLLLRCVGR